MTSPTLATLPLALGAGLAALAGRGISWGANRFMQAPMASTALMLVTGLTLMGAANALFMQDVRHPAPLFGVASPAVTTPPAIEPVVVTPVARPAGLDTEEAPVAAAPAPAAPAQTAAQQTPPPIAIGNRDIAEVQEKLKALGLFDGTVDGYYGPKTADAIRAFEQRHGLPRTGAATPQLIEAVRNASLTTSSVSTPPAPAPVAQPAPAPAGDIGAFLADMEAPAPAATTQVADLEPAATPLPAGNAADVTPQPAAIDPASLVADAAQAVTSRVPPALDRDLISEIQSGLSRLGFLQGAANGVADENTARAIRKFQIFNNYAPTGEVSPTVYEMLVRAGAYM